MGSISTRQSLWFNMDKTQISIMVGITRLFGVQRSTENLREQRSVKLWWNSIISLSLLHNRCYQRQEITHREESSDSEGTMCYANGSSKWHTPAYYYMALSSKSKDSGPSSHRWDGRILQCHQGRAKFLYNRCAVGWPKSHFSLSARRSVPKPVHTDG